MKSITYLFLTSLIIASLSACGFHLRGASDIQFKSVFIQGNTLTISKDLKKYLTLNDIQILPTAEKAELLLELVGEENEKRILSLAGDGTVNEYELYYRVSYRSKLINQPLWSEVSTIESRRAFSYSNATLLSKQTEENKLNEGMQKDAVNRLVRRLSALKKQTNK
ncbi:MAG: LPS assembly lipoprotein LptE [Methylophilaceae bacterium]|nr:LPS assembly lipoprotein LptE [Methylophilaceae bacterium]MDG1452916.1 LPS assembly lipoprotein LptE [Methylophilaceae bacterium]